MDHRNFLASLSAEKKAQLTARSDRAGLVQLVAHLGAIVFVGTLVGIGVPMWWVLLPVQGVLLVFLFTLEHEATHKTPFANVRLNEAVGHLCGVILVLPFLWFRYFHLAHHRFTHDPDRDPELLAGAKLDTWKAYLIHVSGVPTWWGNLCQFAQLLAGRGMADYVPDTAKGRIVTQARGMAVVYVGLVASLLMTPLLFWIWLFPMVLGQPFLRLYLLAEHTRCPHVSDMFANARTTFTTRFMRWLAWNMPYHAEHHAMPMVPFYQLPMLHELTKTHLKETEQGYGAFNKKLVAEF